MTNSQTGSPSGLPTYEVFAVRYATREALRKNHFIGGDPHDGPMPMDYFVWVVRNAQHTFVVDTGFGAEVAAKRGRTLLRTPAEGLAAIGVDVNQVKDVIITHLHYDHVGTFDSFPIAQFHLQSRFIGSAVTRTACNVYVSGRAVVGWCWRRILATITNTLKRNVSSPRCLTWLKPLRVMASSKS